MNTRTRRKTAGQLTPPSSHPTRPTTRRSLRSTNGDADDEPRHAEPAPAEAQLQRLETQENTSETHTYGTRSRRRVIALDGGGSVASQELAAGGRPGHRNRNRKNEQAGDGDSTLADADLPVAFAPTAASAAPGALKRKARITGIYNAEPSPRKAQKRRRVEAAPAAASLNPTRARRGQSRGGALVLPNKNHGAALVSVDIPLIPVALGRRSSRRRDSEEAVGDEAGSTWELPHNNGGVSEQNHVEEAEDEVEVEEDEDEDVDYPEQGPEVEFGISQKDQDGGSDASDENDNGDQQESAEAQEAYEPDHEEADENDVEEEVEDEDDRVSEAGQENSDNVDVSGKEGLPPASRPQPSSLPRPAPRPQRRVTIGGPDTIYEVPSDHSDDDSSDSYDNDAHSDIEYFELPLGSEDPAVLEQQLASVQQESIAKMMRLMGKEGWAASGDSWAAAFADTRHSIAPIQNLISQLNALRARLSRVPRNPDFRNQARYFRKHAAHFEAAMDAVQSTVSHIRRHLPRSRRPAPFAQGLMQTAVPLGVLILNEALEVASGQHPGPRRPRRVELSMPMIAIVEGVAGCLHELVAAIAEVWTGRNDNASRRHQEHCQVFQGLLEKLQEKLVRAKAHVQADLAEAELAEAARRQRLDQERQRREASLTQADQLARIDHERQHRESSFAQADEPIRLDREGQDRESSLMPEDELAQLDHERERLQHEANLRAWEEDERLRKIHAAKDENRIAARRRQYEAFVRSTQRPQTASSQARSRHLVAMAPRAGPLAVPAPPGTASRSADWEFEPEESDEWEPTQKDVRYILQVLRRLGPDERFNLSQVAQHLGRTVPEITKWKTMATDMAKRKYYEAGIHAEDLPEWVFK